jgi:antitoxin component HigA of HigAB toxin-antitoxin module
MLKFKAYITENGIRQSEIAEVLGITKANANLKINGKQAWTLEQVKKLCQRYNISADKYFV